MISISRRPSLTNPYSRKRKALPKTCLCRDLTAQELDELAAGDRGPVRLGTENPWPERVTLTELGNHSHLHDKSTPFAEALLRFGGTSVLTKQVSPHEIARLLGGGQLWSGEDCKTVSGRQSNCHGNSGLYWAAYMDRALLASGLALSEDGLWRSHSWCVLPGETPTIVETTTPRLLYFGEVIDAETAQVFCRDNAEYGLPNLMTAPVREGRAPAL